MPPGSLLVRACVGLAVPCAGIGWLGGALAAEVPPSKPLIPSSGAVGPVLFQELTPEATGLAFLNPIEGNHPSRYLYASSMATGGVAVSDIDGNGLPDVFLVGGPGENKLFLQQKPWAFEDATGRAGVGGGERWGVGAAMADVDNDGDLDIYVCNYLSPNQLFLNDGRGVFAERAGAAGVDFTDASHTASFCDYDGDGDLDLYVLTNRWYRPEGFPNEQTIVVGADGRARVLPQWEKYYDAVQTGEGRFETNVVGRPDLLARNNGDGTFSVVTAEAGIRHRGHGLSATWFDWTGDHRPDLWVGNDFDDADRLYKNNGDGTFTDVTVETVPYTTWFSMGADFGDVDGDGWMDFYIADMAGTTHFKQKTAMGNMGDKTWFMLNARPPQLMRNGLFINARNGRFLEGAWLAGLAKTDWTWAVRLNDFDNDGVLDLYVQAGMSRNFNEKDDAKAREHAPGRTQWDRFEHLPPMKEANLAFRGRGGLRFEDRSAPWGLNHVGMSFGCAVADLDRDGDLDLISVRLDEPVALLRNDGPGGRGVLIDFKGTRSNRRGVGVWLRAHVGGAVQVREVTLARGYLGQDEPVAHFGLGGARKIDRLEVVWPGGLAQEFNDLAAGRFYTLTEPAAGPRAKPDPIPRPLFAAGGALTAAVHEERAYDDFAREPLLPNKMSHWGPAQAWGDIDGDGDPDLYLCQGKYGNRQLFRNDGGALAPVVSPALGKDFLCEDMGAVFFDADGDRDQDLFVVSGGVECDAGSMTLQDRLYLNDGKGGFSAAADGVIPAERDSGGPVAAADFDGDGDLDLFVGGRCVPGAWPSSPRSHLLRNDGGTFADCTPAVAPGLASPGMVTAALWSDANADGAPDLLIAGEWMAPRLFLNRHGRLVEKTDTGVAGLTGWWNALAAADLDGDGDTDYVATNFGLNTKYHATPDQPALVYFGDMEGTGKRHIIEAEYEGNTVFPVRGRSCSSQAMPFIKDKFKTFRDFAAASLPQIYTPQKLEAAEKFAATELRSGVLRNDGEARFRFEPLPWEVQSAPAFGVVVSDFNGDTRPDLAVAQNFSHPQVETQPMTGGLSVIVLGQPDGTWRALRPDQSGISVAGDVRSLALVSLRKGSPPGLSFGLNAAPMAHFLPVSAPRPDRR